MTTKMRLISVLCFCLWMFMSVVFSQEDPSNQELSKPIYQIKSQFIPITPR